MSYEPSTINHEPSTMSHEQTHDPVPARTTQTVRNRILKSSHNDQLSMYSKSIRTQSSKLLILLRPRICHRQVMPGLILSFRLCQNSYRSSSWRNAERGPTKLISPFNTLHSCGNSLRLYFRKKRPNGVTRG